MKVICFYWQGHRWGNKVADDTKKIGNVSNDLASRYVNNLFKGVDKFANKDFEFICFTNEKLNVNKHIELKNFPIVGNGNLPKAYMFSKESGLFGHQVLCLDLDVVVTGDLKDIFEYNGLLCVRERISDTAKVDGDIISFYGCRENEKILWDPLKNDINNVHEVAGGGERYWISHVTGDNCDTWGKINPGQVVSYKFHVKKNGLKDARLVSFHGYPSPHQINEGWLKHYWL